MPRRVRDVSPEEIEFLTSTRTRRRRLFRAINVRALRVEAGLSQIELAERVGVSQAAVSGWENGAPPSLQSLQALARGLGCPTTELLRK